MRNAVAGAQGETRRRILNSSEVLQQMRRKDRFRAIDEIFMLAADAVARGHNEIYTVANAADVLPAGKREDALSYIRQFGTDRARIYGLYHLARCFTEPQRSKLLDEALVAAKALPRGELAEALDYLIWSLPSSEQPEVIEAMLDDLAWLPRPRALQITARLGSRIGELGGPKVVAEFVKVIEDASRIWP
jgi:hypothetical protein